MNLAIKCPYYKDIFIKCYKFFTKNTKKAIILSKNTLYSCNTIRIMLHE